MYSKLADYSLYYDGSISVNPEKVSNYLNVKKLYVEHLNDEIIQYNKNVIDDERIIIKQHLDSLDKSWNIPEHYLTIDVKQYIFDKFIEISDGLSEIELSLRYKRIKYELSVYRKLELFDLLRTMIYIMDVFKEKNVVYGVGRGSSVASYILHLLDVHDIDSVKYNLDFNEFLGKEL